MPIVRIADPSDERLADYVGLTDVALRTRQEPARALYMAESSSVIRRAVEAGHRPRSLLMEEKWLADLDDVLELVGAGEHGEIDVFLGDPDVLREITGLHHAPGRARGDASTGAASPSTSSSRPWWPGGRRAGW